MSGPYFFKSMLNATVKYYAPIFSDSGRNQVTESFGESPTATFPGRVRSSTNEDKVNAGQDQTEMSHVLGMADLGGTRLKRDGKVVVSFPKVKNAATKTYFVLSAMDSSVPQYERWRLKAEDRGA